MQSLIATITGPAPPVRRNSNPAIRRGASLLTKMHAFVLLVYLTYLPLRMRIDPASTAGLIVFVASAVFILVGFVLSRRGHIQLAAAFSAIADDFEAISVQFSD